MNPNTVIKNKEKKINEIYNFGSVLIVQDSESSRITANNVLRALREKPIIYINLIYTYNSLVSSLKKDGISTSEVWRFSIYPPWG